MNKNGFKVNDLLHNQMKFWEISAKYTLKVKGCSHDIAL